MRYLLRLKPKPNLVGFRDVRLTGWKLLGARSWKPPGPTMPASLRAYLKPKPSNSGWKMNPSTVAKLALCGATRAGMPFTTPELEEDPMPVLGPYTESAIRKNLNRLHALCLGYSERSEPAICRPPEPSDFFDNVLLLDRTWKIYENREDHWTCYYRRRKAYLVFPWSVTIFGDLNDEIILADWVNTGPGKQLLDQWKRLTNEIKITFSWPANLTGLQYALACLESGTDPLKIFPRFSGGRVTQMTLMHALKVSQGLFSCFVAPESQRSLGA